MAIKPTQKRNSEMQPTTPEQFNFAIQNSIESNFALIAELYGEGIEFKWARTLPESNGSDAMVLIESDLTANEYGRYMLERFRNVLHAFGYDFRASGTGTDVDRCVLMIKLSREIDQDRSDADYSDFCHNEEEHLKKSGMIY
jgi:hypothetical protein